MHSIKAMKKMDLISWGPLEVARIDSLLYRARKDYIYTKDRNLLEDIAITYEPQETYSINIEKDLASIHKDTKNLFNEYCASKKIPVIQTHRGGGIIWHGPGQIILDALIDLKYWELNPDTYRNIIEETCISTLAKFGICGVRNHYRPGAQGVWVLNKDGKLKKIAFLGWSDRCGLAIHACAINISCDLYPFSFIDPCNLPWAEVSSVKEELGTTLNLKEVSEILLNTFENILYKK